MTAQEKNWQTEFVIRDDLVQKDVYAYETALRILDGQSPSVDSITDRVSQVLRSAGFTMMSNIEAEHYLKAAIKAGWIEDPECELATIEGKPGKRYFFAGENVDEMHPGKVRWYGNTVDQKHMELITPPDPNS